MLNTLLTIDNIIDDRDCDLFINFINDNINYFSSYDTENNPQRKALRFGIDDIYTDSYPNLGLIPGLHTALKRLFVNITTRVQDYTRSENLYVTSFHMGKQFPGARVDSHIDCDPNFNANGHFLYSAVVYLNTTYDGHLVFPQKNIVYQPKAKDLVVFPAKGADWEHEVNLINQDRYNLPIWLTDQRDKELSFF